MDAPTYANTRRLARASDLRHTPAAVVGMLEHLDTASRDVEKLCGGRRFYPTRATRTFDWPDRRGSGAKLWLDDHELAGEPTAVTAAGAAFTDYRLWPLDGPPYRALDGVDGSALNAGSDGISITGPFGYSEQLTAVTRLGAAVASTTATAITVTDGSTVGPGDALQAGTEYMIATASSWVDTGVTLAAPGLALDSSDQDITVADGTAWSSGELLLIGAERMLIDEIAGNVLHVLRAVDASLPAAHLATAPIYALRGLTVRRAALGTTGATHLDDAVVSVHQAPGPVRQLTIAYAQVSIAQESAAWARTIGTGDGEREARGGSVDKLEAKVRKGYGQRGRVVAAGGMLR